MPGQGCAKKEDEVYTKISSFFSAQTSLAVVFKQRLTPNDFGVEGESEEDKDNTSGGGNMTVKVCGNCDGSGEETCSRCAGTKRIAVDQGGKKRAVTCPRCDGTGKETCSNCHGSGNVEVRSRLEDD